MNAGDVAMGSASLFELNGRLNITIDGLTDRDRQTILGDLREAGGIVRLTDGVSGSIRLVVRYASEIAQEQQALKDLENRCLLSELRERALLQQSARLTVAMRALLGAYDATVASVSSTEGIT